MPIMQDGNVYRTFEEQLIHLTNAHRNQLVINEDLRKELSDISTASNLGGFNLVRFAFNREGVFYRFEKNQLMNFNSIELSGSQIGDYFEIHTGNVKDIPAYGYLESKGATQSILNVRIAFGGDFTVGSQAYRVINITRRLTYVINLFATPFAGTWLYDNNPNDYKKQLFNVISDLDFNGVQTQYTSFDLNGDGIFNFVFIGTLRNGTDGFSVYATNGDDFDDVLTKIIANDLLIIGGITPQINSYMTNAKIGDIWIYNIDSTFAYKGNIRGHRGYGITDLELIDSNPTTKRDTYTFVLDNGNHTNNFIVQNGFNGVDGVDGINGADGLNGTPFNEYNSVETINIPSYYDGSGNENLPYMINLSTLNSGKHVFRPIYKLDYGYNTVFGFNRSITTTINGFEGGYNQTSSGAITPTTGSLTISGGFYFEIYITNTSQPLIKIYNSANVYVRTINYYSGSDYLMLRSTPSSVSFTGLLFKT
jgi:hypothetical protein